MLALSLCFQVDLYECGSEDLWKEKDFWQDANTLVAEDADDHSRILKVFRKSTRL